MHFVMSGSMGLFGCMDKFHRKDGDRVSGTRADRASRSELSDSIMINDRSTIFAISLELQVYCYWPIVAV